MINIFLFKFLRNILTLNFVFEPEELKHETHNKKKEISLTTMRLPKNVKAKPKPRQSGMFGAFAKKDLKGSKFTTMSAAMRWMVSRPGTDHPQLALAEKLVKASDTMGVSKAARDIKNDFKLAQAKRRSIYLSFLS